MGSLGVTEDGELISEDQSWIRFLNCCLKELLSADYM